MLVADEPGLGFALVIGAAVALLAFKDLTWGIAAVAAMSYLEAIPAVAGGGVSGSKLITALVIFSWFALITTTPQARSFFWVDHPYLTVILSLFLVWVLLSAVWAAVPIAALTVLGSYGLAAAMFPVAYTALKDMIEIRKFLGVLIVFSFIAAFYGFAIDPSASGASGGDPTAELNRLGGSIGDPNRFAAKLLPGAVIAIAMAFVARTPFTRLFFSGTAAIAIIAVLLSLSRGGLIAALVVALIAPAVIGGARGKVALATVGVLVGAVLALFVLTPPEARQRITESDGGNGRTDIWTVGWRMFDAHPLNGIGAGNFEGTSIHYLIQPGVIRQDEYFIAAPKVAHNSYLHVLSENGIVGLTLFMSIIVIGLSCAFRAGRLARRLRERDIAIIANGIFLATIGVLIANFFISEQLAKLPWLLLALGPVMLAIARERERALGEGQLAASTSS
jgi:O-antigen ligase